MNDKISSEEGTSYRMENRQTIFDKQNIKKSEK